MTNSALIKQSSNLLYKKEDQKLELVWKLKFAISLVNEIRKEFKNLKGLVIKTAGKSELEKTITVRRKIGAFGVEKIFAIHSPGIEKIEVLRQFKVRRKIY